MNFFEATSEGSLELKVPGFYFASYSQCSPNEGFFEALVTIPFAGVLRFSYLQGDGHNWFLMNNFTIDNWLTVVKAYVKEYKYYRK